jgi:outer membrane usher protein
VLSPLHECVCNPGKKFSIAGVFFLVLTIVPRPAMAAGAHFGVEAAKDALAPSKEASSPASPADMAKIAAAPEAAKEADPARPDSTSVDPAAEPVGDETLLLDVRINGQPTGKIGEFVMRRGRLLVRPSELRDLGFRVSDAVLLGTHDLIALSDVHGLSWNLDEKNLILNITAGDGVLQPTMLQAPAMQAMLGHREIESGTGVTLNYDTVGTYSGGRAGGTGSVDLRAFTPRGVASSSWLGFAGTSSINSASTSAVRLDSTYSFADVNSMRRYSVGDYITSSLSWSRPIRLEGVQVNSDFSMRPDLITFPMPTIGGSAAVPSTVQVLTDGNVAATSEVGAGPFQVPQLPVVSGAGTISMTVTNALGQQVTVTQPFYASSSLLAPGLQTFALQSGVARRNWGTISNSYGKMAGAGIYRRGLTSKFTVEGTVEGTPGTLLAGAGGVQQVSHYGVVNFAAAASSGWGHSGAEIVAGAQRIGRVFSLGGSAILATHNFRDVAAMNGDGILRKQISGFASLYFRRFGSMGAAYGGLDQDAAPVQVPRLITPGQHSHIVSANYSIQIHHITFYASEFKDVSTAQGNGGLQGGIMIPFGRRSSVNVSGTSDGNAQVQAEQSAALIGEWGYNAYVSAGNTNRAFGQAQYKSRVGLVTAGADRSGDTTTLRIETQGALSLVDRGLFPSNTIYDSFAIVDTAPVSHVHVLQENRDVGRTNSAGRLLVPDLRSFDLNHLAITAIDVPPDVTLDTATREMRPQDRSGIVVKFPVKFSHAALLQLWDERGKPMPLGSTATLAATGVSVPIGYDGNAYVEDLSARNEVRIERPDGKRCTVSFEYKTVAGEIPSIGPLRCMESKP